MSKKNPWIELEIDFVFKRAWRFGSVQAKDLRQAFSMTARTAERRIEDALAYPFEDRKGSIFREKHKIYPSPNVNPPACVALGHLFEHIQNIRDEFLFFALTGLKMEELEIQHARFCNNHPKNPGILEPIFRALIEFPKAVQMSYISMTAACTQKDGTCRVIPLSTQVIGEQLYLYALRYEKFDPQEQSWVQCYDLRSFALTRIVSSCILNKYPKQLQSIALPSRFEHYINQKVQLNAALTKDQKQVLEHELNIKNDSVKLTSQSLYSFLRLYTDQPIGPNVIWPPLKKT